MRMSHYITWRFRWTALLHASMHVAYDSIFFSEFKIPSESRKVAHIRPRPTTAFDVPIPEGTGTITGAAFSSAGNYLFLWARGPTFDSSCVFNIDLETKSSKLYRNTNYYEVRDIVTEPRSTGFTHKNRALKIPQAVIFGHPQVCHSALFVRAIEVSLRTVFPSKVVTDLKNASIYEMHSQVLSLPTIYYFGSRVMGLGQA